MSSLKDAVEDYGKLVEKLKTHPSNSPDFELLIVEVLLARDKVQVALSEKTEEIGHENHQISDNSKILLRLNWFDWQLKENAEDRGWAEKVDHWRISRCCSEQLWWWYSSNLHQPQNSLPFLVLNFLNFLLLVPIVGLIITTSGQILSLNLGFLGTSTVVLQGFLGFLASKTTLTSSSQWLDWAVVRLNQSRNNKPATKLLFTMLIGGLALVIRYKVLPSFSQDLLRQGRQNYQLKLYSVARHKLEDAAKLEPNNGEVLHLLGKVYEVMSDTNSNLREQARTYYMSTIEVGMSAGYNSLARLSILDGEAEADHETKQKKYYEAASILGKAETSRCLGDEYKPSPISNLNQLNLDLYNNCTALGWTYLNLIKVRNSDQKEFVQTFDRSLAHLDEAIKIWEDTVAAINQKRGREKQAFIDRMFEYKEATAYCLRAQLFEEYAKLDQKNYDAYQKAAKQEWGQCFEVLQKDRRSYEDQWFHEAQMKN